MKSVTTLFDREPVRQSSRPALGLGGEHGTCLGGFGPHTLGGLGHRQLSLTPRRGENFRSAIERDPPLIVHFLVHFSARGTRARLGLRDCLICFGRGRLSQGLGGRNRAFTFAHDAEHGLEQQPVEERDEQQNEEDDPEDRQIRITRATSRPTPDLERLAPTGRDIASTTKRQFIPFSPNYRQGRGLVRPLRAVGGRRHRPVRSTHAEYDIDGVPLPLSVS